MPNHSSADIGNNRSRLIEWNVGGGSLTLVAYMEQKRHNRGIISNNKNIIIIIMEIMMEIIRSKIK